jgi:hypothetical protein
MTGRLGAMTGCYPNWHISLGNPTQQQKLVFADLPNQRACEAPVSTVPTDLIIATARPDIILIESKTVTILELTVPWNSTSSLDNARSRKENMPNYQLLTSDLSTQGYSALF